MKDYKKRAIENYGLTIEEMRGQLSLLGEEYSLCAPVKKALKENACDMWIYDAWKKFVYKDPLFQGWCKYTNSKALLKDIIYKVNNFEELVLGDDIMAAIVEASEHAKEIAAEKQEFIQKMQPRITELEKIMLENKAAYKEYQKWTGVEKA